MSHDQFHTLIVINGFEKCPHRTPKFFTIFLMFFFQMILMKISNKSTLRQFCSIYQVGLRVKKTILQEMRNIFLHLILIGVFIRPQKFHGCICNRTVVVGFFIVIGVHRKRAFFQQFWFISLRVLPTQFFLLLFSR